MRVVPVLVLAACAHSAPAPVLVGRPGPIACDEAHWRDLASSRLRVRVGDRDFVVVEQRRGETAVIAPLRAALVAGTVADRALVRVVTRETPLWAGPYGSPLAGVVVEPGVSVSADGEWASVDAHLAILATGYVPSEATGFVWQAQPPPGTNGKKLGRYAEVLAEPRPGSEHLANIPASEPAYDSIEAGPAGWLHVTASDGLVRLTGWVAPPPPPSPPGPLLRTYDFSDDTIEGDLVYPDNKHGDLYTPPKPLATGCIRARPDDTSPVIGVVTGELRGTREDDEWLRVELWTPWGRITGHARSERYTRPDASE